MKKFIFLIGFLFSFSVFAQSNWIFIDTIIHGDQFFIDKNSIQRSGDSVTFWYKENNKVRDRNGDLSAKVQRTVNCRTREHIMRWLITYDDLDNKGKITSNFAPKDSWRPTSPDSIGDAVRLFVCAGR